MFDERVQRSNRKSMLYTLARPSVTNAVPRALKWIVYSFVTISTIPEQQQPLIKCYTKDLVDHKVRAGRHVKSGTPLTEITPWISNGNNLSGMWLLIHAITSTLVLLNRH